MPYSFVVDWLLPIGNTLDALTAPIGISFRDGYTARKTVADFSLRCSQGANDYGAISNVHVKSVCFFRTRLSSMPLPRLYIKSPFSTTHLISAIALLGNMR